jgi:hypothetical protein
VYCYISGTFLARRNENEVKSSAKFTKMNTQTAPPRSNANRFGQAPERPDFSNSASAANSQVPAKKRRPSRPDSNAGQSNGRTETDGPAAGTWEAAPVPEVDTRKEVAFCFDNTSAQAVLLVGDFTDWEKNPVKLLLGGGGTWHAKVKLPPGRHAYRFLVDGQWQDDPKQPQRIQNEFGSFNNIIEIV